MYGHLCTQEKLPLSKHRSTAVMGHPLPAWPQGIPALQGGSYPYRNRGLEESATHVVSPTWSCAAVEIWIQSTNSSPSLITSKLKHSHSVHSTSAQLLAISLFPNHSHDPSQLILLESDLHVLGKGFLISWDHTTSTCSSLTALG